MGVAMKKCDRCREEKPENHFYKSGRGTERKKVCGACERKRQAASRIERWEKYKANKER